MAFKKSKRSTSAPKTPDLLFRQLTRRKFPDVLPHQQEMMIQYAENSQNFRDVALQLPTGSGKTLVGLLIGEWRRRKNDEKIVFLCPTKQLVNQVVNQANNYYGIAVTGFTGPISNYTPQAKTSYKQAESISVTTYNSLFNTNPFFHDADIIIIDDSHSAENYIASLWSVSIKRTDESQASIHNALALLFKDHISQINYSRLIGESVIDSDWVDKISSPIILNIKDDLYEILDLYSADLDLKYPWSMVKENITSCHVYYSSDEILIRPLIPPTWTHAAFQNPKQRIYMSATLGEGGDLERLMGVTSIHRLKAPSGWDSQGVGRRFFMFPMLSLELEDAIALRRSLLSKVERSLILVPNENIKNELKEDIQNHCSQTIFNANDIEITKDDFINSSCATAIIANRYDGIDFPGNECRLLIIEGLPKSTNAQERFFMKRLGAGIVLNERIRTRVIQAIGRCTRSLEDYSAVLIMGDELTDYLSHKYKRKFLHPELQAELEFGVDQSINVDKDNFADNFDIFIRNDSEWESANQTIVDYRNDAQQEALPCIAQMEDAVKYELKYQKCMWNHDYINAHDHAKSVLGIISDEKLRGYRALWNYFAGSAALYASIQDSSYKDIAVNYFSQAKTQAPSIPWLSQLSTLKQSKKDSNELENTTLALLQVERLELLFSKLGTSTNRNYLKHEKLILEGLENDKEFEKFHKMLGEFLGFDANKVESEASPDPWWQSGNICLVFEDHAEAEPSSSLSATKARQVASHAAWMKENVESCKSEDTKIYSVLITPVAKANEGALPSLSNVYLWPLDEFKSWANHALSIIKKIRVTYKDVQNDLVWRSETIQVLQEHELDMISISNRLKNNIAKDSLTKR